MPSRQISARQAKAMVGGLAAAGTVAYPLAFHDRGQGHFDHYVYLDTIERMHHGQGFYAAYRAAYEHVGITFSQTRSFRIPTPFLLFRLLPVDWLFPAFLVLVVGLTTFLLLQLTEHPVVVLPVTLYLLMTGRVPGSGAGSSESWLLCELWCVPVIAGCLLAWQRGRWWWAAGLAALAVLIREHTVVLLLAGLAAAHVQHRPRRPWIVAGTAAAVLFALHSAIAAGYTQPHATDAPLIGTGSFPSSPLHMMGWGIPTTDLIGLAAWIAAIAALWRRRALLPAAGLLVVPVFGVVVDRPYWGIVMIPFSLFLTGELIGDLIAARRPGAAGAGWSPPRRTRQPGRGSPAGAPVPPSE